MRTLAAYASVDLGGTRVKVLVGRDGPEVLATRCVDTEATLGVEHVLERIALLVEEVSAEARVAIEGVAVGCPGLVDRSAGVTRLLPNLGAGWRDVPVGHLLGARLGVPVHLLNDARMATLAELEYGRGRRCREAGNPAPTLVLLTLGTGVGGGVVVDGRLRLGAHGAAGEIGHVTVEPEGLPCSCGNRGCLETLISGPALVGEALRLLRSGRAPRLRDSIQGDERRLDGEILASAAMEGDADVLAILVRAARFLGIAVANLVTTLAPDAVLLAGGLAGIGAPLLDTVRDTVNERVRMVPPRSVEIAISELGENAGMLGGLALAVRRGEI
jgi:glucokinase